jgi:hypothetical protein
MNRLNKVLQHAVPAIQQYRRDLTQCDPLPIATQQWMCPHCDNHHHNTPYNMKYYRCGCGWHGDRNSLLLAKEPANAES